MSEAGNAPPCKIRVIVHEKDDAKAVIHDLRDDHSNRYFRDHLTKTIWWALRNNKTVVMSPD